MDTFIVDTTLRDGEQNVGIALGTNEKVQIAKLLDELGVYQIEAGIPAMGDDEKASIKKIAALGLRSRISTWNRLDINDIEQSLECGADIIHITVPSSDIQIISKLKKDRHWIIDNLKRCMSYLQNKDHEITVGLEDASRADFKFLSEIIFTAYLEGASRVRYADTVGVMYGRRISEEIDRIRNMIKIGIEIHAHNDFGMAVSNSVAAVMAGASFVDCTIGGIGERAGNCDYLKFIKAAKAGLGAFCDFDEVGALDIQRDILKIIKAGI